jgi:Tfp pilus assembly protein PilF
LGGVYMDQKKLSQAQKSFEKAIEIRPGWGQPYDSLARIYLVRGEKESAVGKFQTALEKNPGNIAAWMLLGSIYEKDKNYDKAAETYAQAFEKNPGLWAAANNYAFIKGRDADSESDLHRAMEYARKAQMLKPDAGIVMDTLGWLQYRLGNLDMAYTNVQKALEQHPENPEMNFHMGMILDKQGKTEQSKLYLEKSLISDKDFSGAETAKKILNR